MMPAPPTAFERKSTGAIIRVPNPMVLLIWLSIFLPGHFFEFWLDRAYSAFAAFFSAMLLFGMPANWDARNSSRMAALFLAFVQLLYVLSFIHAVAFLGAETGMRDLFEVVRYIILLLFIVYTMRHYDDRVREHTELAMAVMLYYSLFVGFCYMRYVPGFSEFFRYKLYYGTKTAVTWFGDLRLAAPFENPNFYGFILTEVFAYMAFFSKSRLRLAHALAALVAIYCTGSRTTWAGAAVIVLPAAAVYIYLAIMKIQLKRALQLAVALIAFAAVGVRYSGDIMKNHRLQMLLNAQRDGGFHMEIDAASRIKQDLEAWEYIKQSPVLGWGPSKYAIWDFVDNQYFSWGLRHGLLGGFLLLLGVLALAKNFIWNLRGSVLTRVGSISLVLSIALQLMAAEYLNNFRTFFITWFIGMAMLGKRK